MAGAATTYSVAFTTSSTGALTAGSDTITLAGPTGTVFPLVAGDYTVAATAVTASPTQTAPNNVTFTTPVAVGISSGVAIQAGVGNTVTNPPTAGSYTWSVATSQDTTPTPSTTFSITHAAPALLTVTGGGGQTAQVGTPYGVALSASLTDAFGNVVPATPVTFAAPASGPSGTFSGSGVSENVNTDTSGVATSHVFTANGTAGTYAVSVSASGVSPSPSLQLTNFTIPGAPSNVTASGGNDSATVHWVAPSSNGFSAITDYVITVVSTGTQVVTGALDHATVNGLTNNVPYTFTVAAINAAGVGPASPATTPVRPQPTGYWLVGSDGGIFSFGSSGYFGSTGAMHLNAPIVGMASTPDGGGYWLVASDGGIFAFGDAAFDGSMGAKHLNAPIVGMAGTPDGHGYWLVASDGGIFSFGDAGYHGSMGAKHLNQPIVGMTPTPSGAGYWLVASDGGIFAFGTAGFFGSTGAMHLNAPIVGMDSPDAGGYWLVASDGGIFAFGDAGYFGSTGAMHLNAPIVGVKATPSGGGYWLAASDGGIFAFGNATFDGSEGGSHLNRPIVGIG